MLAILPLSRVAACGLMPRCASAIPLSTGVWSADGELLRVTLAADDQYRLWTPLRRSRRPSSRRFC